MTHQEVKATADAVVAAIQMIDLDCKTLLNGVQHGLANIKSEFSELAWRATGKELTEEQLIAWLVMGKLALSGQPVDWEVSYPSGQRRKCDLVLRIGEERLWLELKLAWKAWFNCEGPPTTSNPSYGSYLRGNGRTHSFRHDLEKLSSDGWQSGDQRAVCLVGFDSFKAPMDSDVVAVVQQAQVGGKTWELAAESHWPDRRSEQFRISVWCWWHSQK